MTSVNLEKTLEYLNIQESLRCENLTEYYLCKRMFLRFYLPRKTLYKHKIKHTLELTEKIIIICLKGILEECFSFNVNVNARFKFL